MIRHTEVRTEARRRVAALYRPDVVRRIRGSIELGPGFRDDNARRTFPGRLWTWAAEEMLSLQFGQTTPPKGAGRALEQFYSAVRKATHYWVNMPEEQKRWIAMHLPYQRAADDAVGGITLALSDILAAADGAEVWQSAMAQAPRREKYALERLAEVWRDSTGTRPTRTVDVSTSRRVGAFMDFAYEAMLPLFPDMGSIDGLIEQLVTAEKTCS